MNVLQGWRGCSHLTLYRVSVCFESTVLYLQRHICNAKLLQELKGDMAVCRLLSKQSVSERTFIMGSLSHNAAPNLVRLKQIPWGINTGLVNTLPLTSDFSQDKEDTKCVILKRWGRWPWIKITKLNKKKKNYELHLNWQKRQTDRLH